MSELSRRQFVKLSGTGAGVAFGAGVTGAQQQGPRTEQAVEAEFDATISEGTLTLDGGELGDPGAALSISIGQLDGNIDLSGEIYDDKTWTTTSIDFPDVNPGQFIDEADLPDIVESVEFNDSTQVDVVVDSISGIYDPSAGDSGLVTGDADMLIDAFIKGTANTNIGVTVDFELEFTIDLNEGDPLELTTGQSFNLEGSAANLASVNATATVVNNDFTVPEATGPKTCIDPGVPGYDPICINDFLGLPVTNPQRNWIELNLEPSWVGDPPQFGPPPLPGENSPPQDIDGDGLFEDITGTGSATIFDTQALFANLDSDAVQNNAAAFDFNAATPSDEVTVLDVASHWRQNVFGG